MRFPINLFQNVAAALVRANRRMSNQSGGFPGTLRRQRKGFDYGMLKTFLFAAALCIGCSSAQAQSEADVERTLLKMGFTRQDLKSAAILQTAPHYAIYSRWNQCMGTIGGLVIMNGRDASAASSYAIQACVDDERQLRASVAREIGIPRTNRVLAVAKAIYVIAMQAYYRQRPH